MQLDQLSIGNNPPGEINVIVEIPRDSKNKYEFDPMAGVLRLKRVITADVSYPGDYGFIPGTSAADGDPLDALVLVSHPTLPLTLIPARAIGVLKIIDKGLQDDKILCVPVRDHAFDHLNDITDCAPVLLETIVHFFSVYKDPDEKVIVQGWENKAAAESIIKESVK
jgi:inorganic pyrophosphatase